MKENQIFSAIIKNAVQKEIRQGMDATACPWYWAFQVKRPQNNLNLQDKKENKNL